MTNAWKSSQTHMRVWSVAPAGVPFRIPLPERDERAGAPGAERGFSMQRSWRGRAYEHIDQLRAEAEAERLVHGDPVVRATDGHRQTREATGVRVRLGLAMIAAGLTIAGTNGSSSRPPC